MTFGRLLLKTKSLTEKRFDLSVSSAHQSFSVLSKNWIGIYTNLPHAWWIKSYHYEPVCDERQCKRWRRLSLAVRRSVSLADRRQASLRLVMTVNKIVGPRLGRIVQFAPRRAAAPARSARRGSGVIFRFATSRDPASSTILVVELSLSTPRRRRRTVRRTYCQF